MELFDNFPIGAPNSSDGHRYRLFVDTDKYVDHVVCYVGSFYPLRDEVHCSTIGAPDYHMIHRYTSKSLSTLSMFALLFIMD